MRSIKIDSILIILSLVIMFLNLFTKPMVAIMLSAILLVLGSIMLIVKRN